MYRFSDAPSLHQFLHSCSSPELSRLIRDQLAAFADFDDVPLGDLVHFFIVESADSASTLELALSRHIEDIPIEYCLSHAEWFEMVTIVSDDGFGGIIFIPRDTDDQKLLDFCAMQAIHTQGNLP